MALCGSLSLLFKNTTQDHQPRVGTSHSELGPLTSIINKSPYRLAYRPILWGLFSIEVPFMMTPACGKATEN